MGEEGNVYRMFQKHWFTKVNWVGRTQVKRRKKFFNKHQENSFPLEIFS